jgi:hypothetical protein
VTQLRQCCRWAAVWVVVLGHVSAFRSFPSEKLQYTLMWTYASVKFTLSLTAKPSLNSLNVRA